MTRSDVSLRVLSPQVVQVWMISLPDIQARLDSLRGILSPDESRRAEQFAFERDRERFILARGTLRLLLAGYLNEEAGRIRFQYGPHGKPALLRDEERMADLRFNLSHSGDYCLCAVSMGREVGIDVEVVRPDVKCMELAERFFTKREFEDLQAMPEERRRGMFFRYWTCKEACLKARGVGISSGLSRVSLSFNADGSVGGVEEDDRPVPRSRWMVRQVPMPPNVAAAVAAEGDDWEAVVTAYPGK